MTTERSPAKTITKILDENDRELLRRIDNDGDGAVDREERYTRNSAGDIIRTDYDDDGDGWIDRAAFDDDADGVADRMEYYERNVAGLVVEIRFDDDNDGNANRLMLDQDDDGVLDRLDVHTLDADGNRVGSVAHNLPLSYEAASGNLVNDVGVGSFAAPTFADVDGDGDQDLVVGNGAGRLHYFENTSNAATLEFTARSLTDALNPLRIVRGGANAAPAFADLDGDGDQDLAVGKNNGTVDYYENTGSAVFEKRTSENDNPFHGFSAAGARAAPAFADVDRDGDLDLVVGRNSDPIRYYENTGSAEEPEFTERTGNTDANPDPFRGIDAGSGAAPAFADVDRDGDLDLVAGGSDGRLSYYENITSAGLSRFVEKTGQANPFDGLGAGRWSVPAFAGFAGDQAPELVVGTRTERLTHHALAFLWESSFTRDDQGNITRAGFDADGDGTAEHTESYTRDSAGRITRTDYDDDGDGTAERVETYARDAQGRITRTEFDDDGDGTHERTESCVRDANGKVIRIDFNDDGDAHIDRVKFPAGVNGVPARWEHYTYDANGNRLRAEIDQGADGELDWVDVSTLNDAGNCIGFARYDLPLSYETTADALPGFMRGGNYAAPAFADLDDDGDLDLVVGDDSRRLRYFENTGDAVALNFQVRTATANPFHGIAVDLDAVPAFADVDGDGDLDLVTGRDDGRLGYYENTGTATAPAFVHRNGAVSPFSSIRLGAASSPAFVDLDGDGDLDLVVGATGGGIHYFERTGDTTASFAERTAETGAYRNPFHGIDAGDFAAPAFTDLDGDGDWDLVAGRNNGDLRYYENTGEVDNPRFGPESAVNPFVGIDAGARSAPTFADLDGDSVPELVVGAGDGSVKQHKPTAAHVETYALDERGRVVRTDFDTNADKTADRVEHYALNADGRRTHARIDSDADGTADRLEVYALDANGARTGTTTYNLPLSYEETPDSLVVAADVAGDVAPTFVDMDGDGDLDLVVGRKSGHIDYYEHGNGDDAIAPAFIKRTGSDNPFNGFDVGDRAAPAFMDVDGDGDLDLVAGRITGALKYYKNTGDAERPAFSDSSESSNPFSRLAVGNRFAPAFADVDGDGDPDLVVGKKGGAVNYYENTGGEGAALFAQRTGARNPFHGIDVGEHATPALADADRDGDLDLVVGERFGDFHYFENTGDSTAPAFADEPESGDANPFHGIDVDFRSTPTFADLDGDQMPELISGKDTRGLLHYRPAPAPDAPREKVEFFSETGTLLAAAKDADEDTILDVLDYSSGIEVASRIVVAVSGAVAGDIDAKNLVGVSRINLAGAAAGAGKTDLTISAATLEILAAGNSSYQLRIHGDSNDVLRFDRGGIRRGG